MGTFFFHSIDRSTDPSLDRRRHCRSATNTNRLWSGTPRSTTTCQYFASEGKKIGVCKPTYYCYFNTTRSTAVTKLAVMEVSSTSVYRICKMKWKLLEGNPLHQMFPSRI